MRWIAWSTGPAGPVADTPQVQATLTALRRVLTQDLEPDPTTGQRRIRLGGAAERMPSRGDPDMRQGRNTRTRLFTVYKRYVIKLVAVEDAARQLGTAPSADDRRTLAGCIDQLHGPCIRYKGIRKNTLDVRRIAVVANLQRWARLPQVA